MNNLSVVVALITSDNDYQAEQAASATEAAARLGVKIQIVYADHDAVNQTQQLIKIIQNTAQRPECDYRGAGGHRNDSAGQGRSRGWHRLGNPES